MELWIRVADVLPTPCDLAVDLRDEHTVADLTAALANHLGAEIGALVVDRTGARLEPGDGVGESGLRSGDTVRPAKRGRRASANTAPTTSTMRLVVAGGTGAGTAIDLGAGGTTVGRSSKADLTIADPTVSARHATLTLDGDRVLVEDLGSSNGTYVNGVAVTGPAELDPKGVLEVGDVALRVVRASVDDRTSPAVDGRVPFTRGPRVRPATAAAVFELPAPPEEAQKRRLSLATALVPLALAPVMVAITHQMTYLAMAALSPVMAIASIAEDRRSGTRDHQKKVKAFRDAVAATHDAMAEGVRNETAARWVASPDPADVVRRATGPAHDLWERRLADADALDLRVGWGDLPSTARWSMREGGDPALRSEAEALLGQHGVVRSAPATVNMQTAPVVGLAGPQDYVDETARWLVAQAATLHSPRDLAVVVAVDDSRAAEWEWASWLPHCRNEHALAAPFAAAPFAVGDEEGRVLLAALNDLVASRRRAAGERRGQTTTVDPLVLVVLDERLRVPRTTVTELLESAPRYGVRVLWLGEHVDRLPGETSAIVRVTERRVDVTTVTGGDVVRDAQRDRCPDALVVDVAHALAGIRDATARATGHADLPGFVSLPQILGTGLTPESIAATWQQPDLGLGAPIGLADTGPFSLDLRRDGPHALLGGTTGAGKSEMLQTLVASLAAHHPPDRLTFVLIDYKGGAAFKDCVHLPHVVGFVTDLSGHLVNRALVSLGAELHRRERLLAEAGAKDLIEMQRRAPERAPASLLLVIDEFATLAKELPDFVDGVVNVAQRGRSLGIHLLLATQRPAGAINDNIRANTNLRMALRMNDVADSTDVIADPRAAHLPRNLPGRAFVRTGAAELTEVQVAYSGGHTGATAGTTGPLVHELVRGQVRRDRTAAPAAAPEGPTDLERLVTAAAQAATDLAIPTQPAPWLAPLPTVVVLDDLEAGAGERGSDTVATIGLLDEPAHQRQVPFAFDLERDGSLLVLGTSGAGKTTLLRTLAVSLARRHSPAALNIYVLDFASRGLKSLEALPHCGAVVGADEIDRVQRSFAMLERWVAERRRRFAEVGASSLTEYARQARPGRELPRVVVLLDSYPGFASVFEKIEYGARIDQLTNLISEGRPLGIHFVVTAPRRNSIPTTLASLVPSTVVLRMADPDDYAAAGLDTKVAKVAVLPPGRGFQGSTTLEIQCAAISADPGGDAQSAAVARIGAELARTWGGITAPAIGSLPAEVELAPLAGLSRPLRPVVGIGDRDMAPVAVDLTEGHLLVAGPIRSGKSTALATIATGLRQADADLHLVLCSPRRSPLTKLGVWSAVAKTADDIDTLCAELEQRVAESNALLVLVIDDGHELDGGAAAMSLETVARRGRDADVRIVAAADAAAAHRSYGGWLTEMRKDRHGILLQPDTDTDGDLLGVRLPRTTTSLPGRGFLVTPNAVEGLQVASG